MQKMLNLKVKYRESFRPFAPAVLREDVARFKELTGVPYVVSTSFNVRGEPIVCTPEDAFRCFMGTEIETLAVGNCFLRKEDQDAALKQRYPGVTFDFVNGGVPGYTVASSRQNLRHKVAPLEPDVIVVYHASNDLSAEVNALAAAAGLGRAHQQPGWLERHSLLWELVSKNLRAMAARVAAALAGDARVQELIRQRGR